MSENLINALNGLLRWRQYGDCFRVGTTCLLPNGEVIRVSVRGGSREVVVSDDGLALREISNAGIRLSRPEVVMRKYAKRFDLDFTGSDFTFSTDIPNLFVAVTMVANAVADAVTCELRRAHVSPRRDIRSAVRNFLSTAPIEGAVHRERITGKSAQHEFAHVIDVGQKKVIIDPVLPDLSSIGSRVLAHMDIKQANLPSLEQYVVFDNEDKDWTSDRLGLIQMAASIVPFAEMDRALMPRLRRVH